MSVESLLSEVTNILGSRLAVKAADQAFFGGKQVYTGVSSSAGAGSSAAVESALGSSDPLQSAIENAQKTVKKALAGQAVGSNDGLVSEVASLKKENQEIKNELSQLKKLFEELSLKVSKGVSAAPAAAAPAAAAPAAASGGDDFDLFGSDEEDDDEKKRVVEERLKAYNEKKSKKPGPIAKSSVILDVKPWDDETDLGEMEALVRGIEMDGLVWGGGKLIAIGYGIKKLQIICVIEDLKVSVDDLIEKITGDFEDHVQSVDIVAFNKI